jgi:hypothetical protein
MPHESSHPHHLIQAALHRGQPVVGERPGRVQPHNPMNLAGTSQPVPSVENLPCVWDGIGQDSLHESAEYRYFNATGRWPNDS